MVDTRIIDETILEPLMSYLQFKKEKPVFKRTNAISILMVYGVFTSMSKEEKLWNNICDAIMEGDTVLFINKCDSALILTTRKYDFRQVTEPSTESEVRGPHDGFIESIQTNTALIRRRIKDYGLRFDTMHIGEKTKTVVALAYINNLVDESLLDEVKSRLNRIKVDSVLESGYIEELITDSPFTIFPQIANTDRPDKACAAILEAHIVILVDNTPFVLIIPEVFWHFLHSSGDYYENYLISTFVRGTRILALFLSISLSSLYVLLTSYHQEMLPTALALKIASGRSGVPFPAVIEAFLMEIILEIMKEAGLRMPKPLGQAVSIVGTIVIGQAAVSAGLVSPMLVVVIAIAAITSYAIPSYSFSNAIRLVRFPILIITSLFGLLGYLTALIVLALHLISLRSFGTPYLAPVIPFDKSGNKDIIFRAPWWSMFKRPELSRPKNSIRQSLNLKPNPPSKG
jgi:hypothetical protein